MSLNLPFLKYYYFRFFKDLRFLIISFSVLLSVSLLPEEAKADKNVSYFNIQGVKLNMNLDDVIRILNINKFKTSKDKYGLVHGYEIVQAKDETKIVLNFTGQKRLYRIDYSNQYRSFMNNSNGLYNLLKEKYGEPTIENIEALHGESRNISACWGSTCNRFTPTTPALKATIDYASGKLKLTLIDNRIFNSDWKKYKQSLQESKSGQVPSTEQPKNSYDF